VTTTLAATRLRLALVDWAQQSTSPNAGAGTAAAIGSMWLRASSFPTPDEIYFKIQSADTGWIKQNLVNLNIFNVKDFGATGDGLTDDLASINAAITACVAAGGGGVYFPATANYYRVVATAGNTNLISLQNVQDITLFGDGYASKLKQEGSAGGGDTHLIGIRNQTSRIRIHNMYFDVANPTNTNEQTHCIQIFGSAALAAPGPSDIDISECYFGRSVGDCIRTLGEETKEVDNVRIRYCAFDMTDANPAGSRAGVSAQRFTRKIQVHFSWFRGSHDQQIDFEPTGAVAPQQAGPEEWSILGNLIDHQSQGSNCLTLSGVGEDPSLNTKRCICAYNTIINGGDISGIKTNSLVVIGNIVLFNGLNTIAVMEFQEAAKQLQISSNILRSLTAPVTTPFTRTALTTLFQNGDSGAHWCVSDNIMSSIMGASGGGGGVVLSMADCSNAIIAGNLISYDNLDTLSAIVTSNAVSTNVHNITTIGNMVFVSGTNARAGFAFGDAGGIQSNASARHNWTNGATNGIRWQGGADYRGASENVGINITSQMLSVLQATAEGAAGPGQQISVTQLAAGPETAVAAPIGSIALNNVTQNNIFFYKDAASGVSGGNTGWQRYAGVDVTMGTAASSTNTAARFLAPGGQDLATETTVELQWTAPRVGTIRNLRVNCTAGVGSLNVTYTVRKNGVNTTLTTTFNNTLTASSDTTHSFTVVAGDLISIQITKVSAPATPQTNIAATVEFI
jgi:pectate lyase-like protein